MSFLELVKNRYSVRSYKQRAIDPEKLQYVMECTRLSPSAVNLQPWKFYIVSKPEDCAKIRECYHRDWFNEAPMYIIACSNHDESWKRRRSEPKDHADIDISIAVEHLCLAAAEVGLGTCWVCNFDVELCRSHFGITAPYEPAVLIPIGYPTTDEVPEKTRKPMDEVFVNL